jgi:hypothetical protein
MSAGFVSAKIFDEAGRQLDSDAVLAYYYISNSPLYELVSSLVRVSNIGDLFSYFRREGFKVRFSKEEGVWRIEHYSYPVKAVLHPEEDGGFLLEVIVPAVKGEPGERALLGAWRALKACNELREELEKLRGRVSQLEDRLKELGEELRAMVESVDLKVERLKEVVSEGEGEEQE